MTAMKGQVSDQKSSGRIHPTNDVQAEQGVQNDSASRKLPAEMWELFCVHLTLERGFIHSSDSWWVTGFVHQTLRFLFLIYSQVVCMNYWQIYGYPDKLNAFIKISPPYTTEATGGAGWCVSHSLERCSQLTIPKIWYRAYQLLHLPIQNAGGGARPLLMHKAASTSDRRKQLHVEKMRQLCQISAKQPQSELLGWFYFCKKQMSGCLKKQGTFFSWRALLFFTKKLLP